MTLSHPTLLQDFHLLAFDELDSTNDEAKRLARSGGSHGAIIWAKRQTAGRGRMERGWHSPVGNLHVSVLLTPGGDVAKLSQLSFVAAVAAREAIVPVLPDGAKVQLKWPNDLLIGGKKVGGILVETFRPPSDPRLWAIVGFGLNIESAPKDVLFPATCLKGEGVDLVSAKIVLSRFIHHFIVRYNGWAEGGFAGIRENWLKNAWMLHKKIRIVLPQEEMKGTFAGLEEGGSLILEMTGGKRQVVPAGDMFSLRAAKEAGA